MFPKSLKYCKVISTGWHSDGVHRTGMTELQRKTSRHCAHTQSNEISFRDNRRTVSRPPCPLAPSRQIEITPAVVKGAPLILPFQALFDRLPTVITKHRPQHMGLESGYKKATEFINKLPEFKAYLSHIGEGKTEIEPYRGDRKRQGMGSFGLVRQNVLLDVTSGNYIYKPISCKDNSKSSRLRQRLSIIRGLSSENGACTRRTLPRLS